MKSATQGLESRASSPLDIVLDLVRVPDTDASARDTHVYRRRLEDGGEKSASFHWSPHVESDVAAVQQARVDPAAAARLGDTLRAFLQPLEWWRDEERIQEALDARRPIRLKLRLGAAELHTLPWELVVGLLASQMTGTTGPKRSKRPTTPKDPLPNSHGLRAAPRGTRGDRGPPRAPRADHRGAWITDRS